MSFKKIKADYLFTGTEMLGSDNVLIIDENGIVKDIKHEMQAGDDVKQFSGIISPGFINCHCHLELSHLKGVITEGTGLVSFLIEVTKQRNSFSQEKINDAIDKALQELYYSGTVAIGDVANTTFTLPVKQKSKLHFYNFIEVAGFTNDFAEDRFRAPKEIAQQFKASILNCQLSMVPHAPYSVSQKMFKLLNNVSENKTITIHNQETPAENELYQTKSGGFFRLYDALNIDTSLFEASGKTSLQTYLPWLNKAKNIILVHNTFTAQADVEFANQLIKQSNNQQLYWCICANANLYIEGKMPPVDLLRKNNCNMVLGTDSYASNYSLSMLDEIKRIHFASQSTIPLHEILQWATIKGAKALQMDDLLGSFDKGKQPGIILIDNIHHHTITNSSTALRII